MKKRYLLFPITLLMLVFATNIAFAQVTAGPSDAITAPPANIADVGKILCAGQTITITGPQDAGGVDYAVYHWYKIDAGGNAQLATITTRIYTETATTAGYYNYKLITINTNSCESPISDVFKVFVLPPLTVNITSATAQVCAGPSGTLLLTANITPATGYTINCQWNRNGTPISGATSTTYAITGETVAATVNFGVTVSFALNPTCTQTDTKAITVVPIPSKPMITAN